MFAAKPDLAMVLTSWTWAPLTDLAVLLGTLGYAWLAHHGWPVRRTVSWGLAMLALLLAGNSAVAVYGDVLFWVHMVQHLLLIMIAPILLVWAQPVRLVQTSLPSVGVRLERLLKRRPVRWATAPLTGLALYSALVVLTHLTGFQQISATHSGVRAFELAAYLAYGWLFFFPLLGGELGSWSLPYLLRFLVLALGMGADTLTGVALMLTSRPLAPAYAASHPGWGPGALLDQEAAGAIMWFGGDLLMMILMIVVAVQWGRAGPDQQGLGSWLEGARRRALLGAPSAGFPGPGQSTDNTDDADGEIDIDEDQRALDAYNAALAALHAQSPPQRPGSGQGPVTRR
ncbi:MAG TPA: cytochrome c oxidase assembly protein [Pseudonocardia sp.]|nr:cytochrome c oxidase assembly protein [Pseudonocardia sp.]